jgi:carbonic anhydrase
MDNLTALKIGYRAFRNSGWKPQRDKWAKLAQGQSPKVMIIACSDSRVDPATIFNVAPGEVFVVRNVANLVPPYKQSAGRNGVCAAIEFAVTQLEVETILVMGHGQCGGIAASLSQKFMHSQAGEGGFIAQWLNMLQGVRDSVVQVHGEQATTELEHEAIKMSLANLRSFPFVQTREQAGSLALFGGWFAIDSGQLHLLDETSGVFETL